MSTYNEFLSNEQPSSITRFLWWCAGADSYFLKKSPVGDRVKYFGIGGIVFATGLLAAFAGGFAFYTAFGPKGMGGEKVDSIEWVIKSGVFGVIWGIIILNIDRFIVSSTGKGDGTDSITRKELFQAFPRLIIAFILGITISKPLELKIIETEINVQLRKEQQLKLDEFNNNTYLKYKKQLAQVDVDLKKIEDKRNELFQIVKNADKEYIDQMQGRSGLAGFGPRAKQLEQLKIEKQKELDDFDQKYAKEIVSLKKQREKLLNEQDKELNVTNLKQAENLDGLLARISIAHKIGLWLGIALTAIFLSIEMGPIFFKLMMTKGPYDYMVENQNYTSLIENGIYREDKIFEGAKGLIHMEKWHYLDVDATKHEKIEKLKSQKVQNSEIIKQYTESKLEEIRKNPSDFIVNEQ
jgi:hypothetical protein